MLPLDVCFSFPVEPLQLPGALGELRWKTDGTGAKEEVDLFSWLWVKSNGTIVG